MIIPYIALFTSAVLTLIQRALHKVQCHLYHRWALYEREQNDLAIIRELRLPVDTPLGDIQLQAKEED